MVDPSAQLSSSFSPRAARQMNRFELKISRQAAEKVDIANVCDVVHNAYMTKNAAITIRIPASLKRSLEARADKQHRSLSAQVVADLETILDRSRDGEAGGKFLGLFRGTPLPNPDDIKEVRTLLWGSLASR